VAAIVEGNMLPACQVGPISSLDIRLTRRTSQRRAFRALAPVLMHELRCFEATGRWPKD
jgi:hypothetical protein